MKIYLITGVAGFIGANFLKYILKKHEDINVIVVDSLTYAGNLGTIKEDSLKIKWIMLLTLQQNLMWIGLLKTHKYS